MKRAKDEYAYDVFLSFRGEDTRKTFTDHLYTALVDAGLRTFRDDDEIERGENIKSEVEEAIGQSRSSIIVFSKDYASSAWCLDELRLILHQRKAFGHTVLPVFYDVDPTNIRRQTGSVLDAFTRHESRLNTAADDQKKDDWMNKVNQWKAALREAADLSGMVLKNESDGYESKFIQKVVRIIEDKVSACNILTFPPKLVGIDTKVEYINSWLRDESSRLRDESSSIGLMAITGMSGIGKTTIAKCVFNMNLQRFAYTSFLANIRESFEQPDAALRLQRQILSDILKGKAKEINNINDGIMKIKDAVSRGRVLMVLDDVDHKSQMDAVLGMREWFYPGSKIIITTKNIQLLKLLKPLEMCVIQELCFRESLELFSWHAFGDTEPGEEYSSHSERIVRHCQGLPLALQVLGSSLRGRSLDVWESALNKLQVIPHAEIQSILQISYNSLQDDHDKELFLDIAFFFRGKNKDFVIRILDECGHYTVVGIENLIDRCMLTIDGDNKLRIHQLVQSMAREIVRQQSLKDPGKRNRLWYYKDSFQVLKEETGTKTVEGLALNMNMLMDDKSAVKSFGIYHEKDACFKIGAISKLSNLRLLQINHAKVSGDYKDFPKKLRWLCWHGFILKSLPSQFPLDKVVALEMQYSNLQQFCLENKVFGSLKYLNFSHSCRLIKISGLSKLPALEVLKLKGCASLDQIDESIGLVEGLVTLNLKDCRSLKKLPTSIGMLKFLQELIISGCSSLHMLQTLEMGKLESLKVFHADGVSLGTAMSTSQQNTSLCDLVWGWVAQQEKCTQFSWAFLLRSLTSISLVGCNLSDNDFPRNFCNLSSLTYLNLSKNPICFLPDCFKGLRHIGRLEMKFCTRLQALSDLCKIKELNVQDCPILEEITFHHSPPYCITHPWGCTKLVECDFLFSLVAVENIETQIIQNLGINVELESLRGIQMQLYNGYTRRITKGPIQGVLSWERRLQSICFPGSRVPSRVGLKTTSGSCTCISNPSSHTVEIQCLTVCFVYKFVGRFTDNHRYSTDILIYLCDKRKELRRPDLYQSSYGIPEGEEEYMISLVQFQFNHCDDVSLEAGQELAISVGMESPIPYYELEVKEVGVKAKVVPVRGNDTTTFFF